MKSLKTSWWDKTRVVAPLLVAGLATGNAYALGLGKAVGAVVIGQTLRIEIPLLGSDAGLPAADCFRVRAPATEIESAFVLRKAQIQVLGERGRARLLLTSASPVREPVLEFGVTVACGYELTKDYLLLAALPTEAAPSAPVLASVPALPAVEAPLPAAPAALPQPEPQLRLVLPSDKSLHIDGATTLEALAQKTYPQQPMAREKFMRMLRNANPGLQASGGAIAAGSDLQLPAGLPVRRQFGAHAAGASVPASKPAPAIPAKPIAAPPSVVDTPAAVPEAKKPAAKPAKDVLVLGAAQPRSNADLLAEAERLTAVLMEQTQSQEALMENIARLENTVKDLKAHYAGIESRLNRIEAERIAEKQVPKPASLDFGELLLAVLAGGALGALGLHLFKRAMLGRDTAPVRTEDATAVAKPAAATKPSVLRMPKIDLPWAWAKRTEGTAGTAPAQQNVVAPAEEPMPVRTAGMPREVAPPAPPTIEIEVPDEVGVAEAGVASVVPNAALLAPAVAAEPAAQETSPGTPAKTASAAPDNLLEFDFTPLAQPASTEKK